MRSGFTASVRCFPSVPGWMSQIGRDLKNSNLCHTYYLKQKMNTQEIYRFGGKATAERNGFLSAPLYR